MITPPRMLTKKKQAVLSLWIAAVPLLLLLFGCRPSGPDALLEGRRLLEDGQPASAMRRLREATLLMPTNAMAWGYLGLAYHCGASSSNAVRAYTKAISLNPDLAEVRFNLGLLLMEQGRWAQAHEQFAATTLLRRNLAVAWQRLGEAQVRLGQYDSAVQSLNEALRLDSRSADAWNWLGVAQTQQGRPRDAARSFQAALDLQTNHGPALLNLAILNQTRLKAPHRALELYQQYLAFLPNSPKADEVTRVITQLEAQLHAEPKRAVVVQRDPRQPDRKPQTESSSLKERPLIRTNLVAVSDRSREPVPPSRPASTPGKPVESSASQAIRVEPRPTIATSTRTPEPSAPSEAVSETSISAEAVSTSESSLAASEGTIGTQPRKRGFFAKINPLNLFKKKSGRKQPTPLPPKAGEGLDAAGPANVASEEEPDRVTMKVAPGRLDVANLDEFRRYQYRFNDGLRVGDREAADRAFKQAETLKERGRNSEAIQAYLVAVRADTAHFAAQFNLGLLYLDAGELSGALDAFEAASRIEEDSVPARYNFALALKAADYPVDSANELLILLAHDPDDTRAHLTLGNLYAQKFGDRVKAREHYTRVLALDPGHSQASSIRFWLVQNPL